MHTFQHHQSPDEGGTHEEGFRKALTVGGEQVRQGPQATEGQGTPTSPVTISGRPGRCDPVKVSEPQFEGQTTKLGNTEVKSFVHSL